MQITVDDLVRWYLDIMDEHPEPEALDANAMLMTGHGDVQTIQS
jgi:hypothetical protein